MQIPNLPLKVNWVWVRGKVLRKYVRFLENKCIVRNTLYPGITKQMQINNFFTFLKSLPYLLLKNVISVFDFLLEVDNGHRVNLQNTFYLFYPVYLQGHPVYWVKIYAVSKLMSSTFQKCILLPYQASIYSCGDISLWKSVGAKTCY